MSNSKLLESVSGFQNLLKENVVLDLSKLSLSDLDSPPVREEVKSLLLKLYPELDFEKNSVEELLQDRRVRQALAELDK